MKLVSVIAGAPVVPHARPAKLWSLKVAAVFVSSACFIGSAWPQGYHADDLAQDQISVRELMRLDTALALSQAKDKERAEALGVDEYLVKSQVVISDVVSRIKHHLGLAS